MKKITTLVMTLAICFSVFANNTKSKEIKNDYISFAKAYGIMRYYSPNHHTENWNDIDWFKVGYYFADKIDDNQTEDVIKEMAAVLAPEAFISNKPKSKSAKNVQSETYQYRLHTGSGSISVSGYTPYYREIITCNGEHQEYSPETGRWYCYELGDRLYLNLQSSARRDCFSKEDTDNLLLEANRLWESLYDEEGDYMSEVISIFNDRTYRVTDLTIRWNIIQHFYPYKTEDGLDWESQLPVMIEKAMSDEFNKAERNTVFAYREMLQEMYSPIKDAHLDIDGSLSFPGLPARYLAQYYAPLALSCFEDCVIIDDSGLEIEKGSRLTKISGTDIEDVIKEKSQRISQTNKTAERWSAMYEAISTVERDSVMTITYITPAGEEKTVKTKCTLNRPVTMKTPKAVFEKTDNILIVNLCEAEAFNEDFYESFMKRLEEENPKAIIFDVRGYPTYYFEKVLSHLTDKDMSNGFFRTPLTTLPNQANMCYDINKGVIKPIEPHITIPCYFLADYRAMSWAETVLMYVKEYYLGTIIGTPSTGTTGDITQFTFPAFNLRLTGLHAAWLDGSRHHGIGVEPDIRVEVSADDHLNGRDVVIEETIRRIQ